MKNPRPVVSDKMLSDRIKNNIGKKGLKVKRVYTKRGTDRYDGIEFESRTSKITNPDGSVVFEMKNIEIPKDWSQIATDIIAQKYFRKKGVPQLDKKGKIKMDKNGEPILGAETSAKQTVDRLAGAWREWGEKYRYFDSKEDADAFEDEIAYMLMTQVSAPNSPQWFNTGLSNSYGIKGQAQGHWYVDPQTEELKQSEDAYTRAQPHACFILSIQDDLVNEGGIFDMVKAEARIFKYGSGSGINFSPIRGSSESLAGGGKSSGLMSFLKIFDSAAGAIKSGGTTRRAAKMVCLNIDHPEIEEFINWKVIEEQKVAALVAGSHVNYDHLKKIIKSAEVNGVNPKNNPELKKLIREAHNSYVPLNYIKRVLMLVENGVSSDDFSIERYDTDFRSEAYTTVGGQNSNNSVRITNKFFDAVEKDLDWDLVNRTDGNIAKTIKAKELWEKIKEAAWQSADPGVQYDTTINEWHTTPNDGRINGSNPCSEYMFLDDTACNLASLNLLKFYDFETKEFDTEKFIHATRLWTIVLEISVLMAHLPTKAVAEKTYLYRTLGLGYGNLGALLMSQGVPYESDEGYAITGAITAIMGGESYATSAEMAKVIGAFSRYNANKKEMLRVIRNHRRAAYDSPESDYENLSVTPMGINHNLVPEYLSTAAKEAWDYALQMGEEFGYRNAQTTLIAPTGTIGLLMDFDTTGVEVDFALVKFKKLVGGGYFKIVNQSVRPGLEALGYSESQIQEIEKYIIGYQTLVDAPYINTKTLAAKGFTEKELMLIEGRLSNIFELSNAFSRWILGDEFLIQNLGVSQEELNDPEFNLLKKLGFTNAEIEAAEEYVCGAMTIEGAPYLRAEHYAVFDCANRCGKKGQRYVGTMGHLKQMAASQPFLSGAISKTVNLPEDASLEDIEDAYLQGWRLMLKSNALYRDGSKLSQPLNTSSQDSAYSELFNFADDEVVEESVSQTEVQRVIMKEQMVAQPKRRRLPDERHSITHKFSIGGHEGYITVGLFEDGNPGEMFIIMSTAGSFLSGIMDAFALSTSLNLQYGVPLEVLVSKLTNSKFEPSGMTTNKEIPMAKSIIDYIGRWLALKFLDADTAKLYHNEELVEKSYKEGGNNYRVLIPHINGKGHTEIKTTKYVNVDSNESGEIENVVYSSVTTAVSVRDENSTNIEPMQMKLDTKPQIEDSLEKADDNLSVKIKKARSMGFTGDMCTSCGSMNVKKNGSCLVCTDCGTTSGCS
jgi:ribonucleoside-diphosphate reductase alpha chain